MTENRDELLPCPFCGSDAERYPDGDMEGYSVMCSGRFQGIFNSDSNACPLAGHAFYKTQADANASWNRRAARSLTDGGQDAVQIFGPVKQAQDGTLYRTGQATGTVAPEQSGAGEPQVVLTETADSLIIRHGDRVSVWAIGNTADPLPWWIDILRLALKDHEATRSQLEAVTKERDEMGPRLSIENYQRWQAAEQRARDIREDAERYRWLVENHGFEWESEDYLKLYTLVPHFIGGSSKKDDFDAIVDAAIANSKAIRSRE
jgi:hypothetical protein